MKVLFWLSIGLDRRSPSEHLLTDMVEALYERGHTVHVLQKNTNGPMGILPKRMFELGVETTRIDCVTFKKSNLIGRFADDIMYVMQCISWLRKHREFDRVFMQSSNVAGIQTRILWNAQKRIPVVFNVQDIFPENAVYGGVLKANGLLYKGFAAMQSHAYRYASKIITISEDMKEQLTEIGVCEDKIDVIYNWGYCNTVVSTEKIDYSCLDGILDRTKFNVVYAGNIGMMQNVELVVRAAAQMKQEADICFHVFGDGMYRKKLEQLAQAINADNVFFHDMMNADCAPAIYSAADVNVIPLAKNIYRTALPSKTATCLACGKPVIFAIGRESQFVKRLTNAVEYEVVDSDDVAALCESIRRIGKGAKTSGIQDVFERDFSRTGNSNAYVRIIENV